VDDHDQCKSVIVSVVVGVIVNVIVAGFSKNLSLVNIDTY
jgi:hypothetical protein